jgi:pimeloyl-ACP methyl ester carboxylesterase
VNAGGWRTDDAELRFRELEDELLSVGWPGGVDTVEVETRWGRTHIYRWPGEGPPIVFLHGMGGTGATYPQYVERLAGRDMYGIDTPGDVGRSVAITPLKSRDDLGDWLDDTLAALDLDDAHLIGTSYGGILALNMAIRRPRRIASITVIDPGALAPLRLVRFVLWGVPMLLGFVLPGPLRRFLAKKRPLLEDRRVTRAAFFGQRHHRFDLPDAEPFADDELRGITVPTSVFIGAKSAAFDATIAAKRAQLIQGAVVDVIDGGGHDVSWTHVDRCTQHLLPATTEES